MPSRASQRIAEVRAEGLLTELLSAQGWDTRRPPNGDLLRQQEYKDNHALLQAFAGRSKTGGVGHGLPEALLVDRETQKPLVVIEVKARRDDIGNAAAEAKAYDWACVDAGLGVLAVGLAGTSDEGFAVSVFKWQGKSWEAVTYEGNPIGWIPNRHDVERLLPKSASAELRPTVPAPEVLAARADEINRLLRESGIKDEFRPAVVAAVMLALWRSKGEIRRSPEYILQDINQSCARAFWRTKRPDLAKSLRVDESNEKLAVKARRILSILERLNVAVLTAEHDYLGQLYETFFQYTGGNTIGQYFTPRNIAVFMADLVETDSEDLVLDPACGTGGFLIAAMHRVHHQRKLSREQVVNLVGTRLVGFDNEPVTAALCIANMILRGDGSTGIHYGDAFTSPDFPVNKANVLLMNPPFPHRKTDTPPEDFLERGLEGLARGGRAAVIMPTSDLVKRDKRKWRQRVLEQNTLEGVIGLPDDLFEPFASSYTGVVLIKKGTPHPSSKPVFFARITNDGYEVRKRVKVPREGEQLTAVLDAYRKHGNIAGLCGWAPVDEGSLAFAPGLYVPPRPLSGAEVLDRAGALIRNRSAFAVAFAPSLWRMEQDLAGGRLTCEPNRKRKSAVVSSTAGTIGGCFHITYGQKELHSKLGLKPGSGLVISSSGIDNGCYGFFDFSHLIAPPFVTVPSTGSIGQAHVQEWACGVTDDCLVLTPKDGVRHELLYVAAAVIRAESWRFSYGMKITPERIAAYPLPSNDELLTEVRRRLETAAAIERVAFEATKDELDG